MNEKLLAIGSQYTDQDTGEKIIPMYYKSPNTGIMSTKLFTIGTDQKIVEKNKNFEADISLAVEDIKANNNDPEAIAHYKTELQNQYGESAVAKLDENLIQ